MIPSKSAAGYNKAISYLTGACQASGARWRACTAALEPARSTACDIPCIAQLVVPRWAFTGSNPSTLDLAGLGRCRNAPHEGWIGARRARPVGPRR